MTHLNDAEMRDLLNQLTAKTNEGTIRWQAVGLHALQAQYEEKVVEINLSYGYRRYPPGKWPVWYRLAIGRSIPSQDSNRRYGRDSGILYSFHQDALEKGLFSTEGRTWQAMGNLYRSACEQDGRAENLRSWSRVEWGCFQGCVVQGYRIWILVNCESIVAEKPLSQPARFSLPLMEPLEGSIRARFSASLRSSARFSGQLSLRFRDWSSLNTTSNTQCRLFSIPQCSRTMQLNRSGENAWLSR